MEHVSEEQLSLLIDGELSLTAREAVIHHLATCPGCAERHDLLVEATAALRLQPELAWTKAATARAIARLHSPPSPRDRALTLSLLLAGAGAIVSMLAVLLLTGSGVVASVFGALASLVAGGLAITSPHTLIVLGALVCIGLLAYPLAHSR
jgi:anti-sigma factor RsiW